MLIFYKINELCSKNFIQYYYVNVSNLKKKWVILLSAEEMKSIINRFFDEIGNNCNMDSVDELFTPDFKGHGFPSIVTNGCEGIKETFNLLHMALPNVKFTIDDIETEEDKVTVCITGTGTNTGSILDIEPTGLKVTIEGTCLFRIENNKIAEGWFKN